LAVDLGKQHFCPILSTMDVARPQLRRQTIALAIEQQVIAVGLKVAVVELRLAARTPG
jgi:hypothetical protein